MRMTVVDIETTNLSALMGRVLCASFYPIYNAEANKLRVKPKAYTLRADRAPYKVKGDLLDDTLLLEAIRDELDKYNAIVTWNGKLFDIPFMNARLMRQGKRRIEPQFHIDAMYYAGGCSARIGSKKLVNVQKFLDLKGAKTELKWETWQRASAGNKKAMNEVVEHCEADVEVTAEAYWYLLPAIKNVHR